MADREIAPWDTPPPTEGGETAPWDTPTSQPAEASDLSIVNETHPEITVGDRAFVKNFSTKPEVTLNYLREKHPGLEIIPNETNPSDILIRKPGEKDYRRLDPVGFKLTDLPADIADIGYDIARGVGTAAATAAGGVASVGAGGVGAIPAGAGSEAVAELLKQYLGDVGGLKNNYDMGDVGVSAAVGGAAPLLFGSGASTAALAKAAGARIAEKNAAKAAAGLGIADLGEVSAKVASPEDLAKIADKMDLKRYFNLDVPEVLPGVNPREIGGKGFFGGAVEAAKDLPQFGILGRARNEMGKLTPIIAETTSGIDREVWRNIRGQRENIDKLAKLDTLDASTRMAEDAANVIDKRRVVVGKKIGELKSSQSEVSLLDAEKVLQEMIDKVKGRGGSVPADTALAEQLSAIKADILPTTQGGSVTFETAATLHDRLKEMALRAKTDPGAFGQGVSAGKSLDTRTLINTTSRMADVLKKAMSKVPEGPALKQAQKEYSTILRDMNFLNKRFATKATESEEMAAAKGLGKLAKMIRGGDDSRALLNRVRRIDKTHGTRLERQVKQIHAAKTYQNAPLLAVSGIGGPSTAKTAWPATIGGLAGMFGGAQLIGGYGAGTLGALAGGAAGALVGGPWAVGRYARGGEFARSLREGSKSMFIPSPVSAIDAAMAKQKARSAWNDTK